MSKSGGVPPTGSDMLGRREGDVVPVPLTSLACDGPSRGLPTCPREETASVEGDMVEVPIDDTEEMRFPILEAAAADARALLDLPGVESVPKRLGGRPRRKRRRRTNGSGSPSSPENATGTRMTRWEARNVLEEGGADVPEDIDQEVDRAIKRLTAAESLMVRPTYKEWEGVPVRGLLRKMGRGLSPVKETLRGLARIAKGVDYDRKMSELAELVDSLRAQNRSLRLEMKDLHSDMARLKADLLLPTTSASTRWREPKEIPRSRVELEVPAFEWPRWKRNPPSRDDVEAYPPLPTPQRGWTTVQSRRQKKRANKRVRIADPESSISSAAVPETRSRGATGRPPTPRVKKRKEPVPRNRRRPLPSTAAVTITATRGGSYADIMGRARRAIDLEDIGINADSMILRRAINGGMKFEISGPNGPALADRLARDLETVVGMDAKIARPEKMAEIRLVGLDDSLGKEEVLRAVCILGECPVSSAISGEIRRSASGLGALWIRLPLAAANKVSEGRRVRIGWSWAGVRLLERRPLQCYSCLEFGHAAIACRNDTVRKGRCFNCGDVGHVARDCANSPSCPLCHDAGRASGHRMGGRACTAIYATRKRRGGLSGANGRLQGRVNLAQGRPTPNVRGRSAPREVAPSAVVRRGAPQTTHGEALPGTGAGAGSTAMPPPPLPPREGRRRVSSPVAGPSRLAMPPAQEEPQMMDTSSEATIGGHSQADMSADPGWGEEW